MTVTIDKSLMKDSMGRLITQSMFYEPKYALEDCVQFTLGDEDKIIDGRNLLSLKRLYLMEEDIKEYNFATKYLAGWKHWKRLNNNKFLRKEFDEWRDELEYKLQSQAVQKIVDLAEVEESFAAAKWLAEAGWNKRGVGRPSKTDVEAILNREARSDEEFDQDFNRLNKLEVINGGRQ